jgi:thiamine biosynthesis lipoprotein
VSDWQALGTSASVVTTDPDALRVAREAVECELAAIDLAASRFREDSDLSRVNSAAGRRVTVSALFVEALDTALRAAAMTDGAVDPTVGEPLVLAGYDRDFALLGADAGGGTPPPRVKALRAPGIGAITLDARRRTVAVARGVRLDLGATAKALAADRSAAAASHAAGCGVLVSLGGDISVAGEPPDGGWRIRVCEDHAAPTETAGQTISIAGGGLATSSTTTRRWRDAEGARHHIINPATGSPAEEIWRTASVAAATCVDANAAATAAIVMGETAVPWLSGAALPARLVAADGSVLRVGDWPAEGDD